MQGGWVVAVVACAVVAGCKVGEKSASGAPGKWEVGVAAYTFRQYTLLETIDRTKECGGETLELFTWQALSPEHRDVKVDPSLTDAQVALIQEKLRSSGIRAVNAYVGNDVLEGGEASVRRAFEFARRLGLSALTGEVPPATLDIVEKMAKEYDVRFCFHNHPRNPAQPDYKNWDPAHVLSLLKDRDPRIGVSLDIGHLGRSSLDPVAATRLLGPRIISVHLKDAKQATADSPDVPLGEGISNVRGVLAELRRQGFRGQFAVEYENESGNLMDDVKKCIRFVRGVVGDLR
jgi:sugar phosphate isomerase/epimerase